MARYIDADKLIEALQEELDFKTAMYTEKQNYYFNAGLKCAVRNIKSQPSADVVPKSEVEELVQDGTRLGQENETLKDINEHLAVMLEEAKTEIERLQAEKDALIKNYAECMKDYASEIFAEIEKHLIFNAYGIATISDKTFAELKKKYTED